MISLNINGVTERRAHTIAGMTDFVVKPPSTRTINMRF